MNSKKKGTFGYINSYKKFRLIISLILAAMISFTIITMLIMVGTTKSVLVIVPILLTLPFAKFLVGYIMVIKFKPIDKDVYEKINDKINLDTTNLLFDVVITEAEGMKFFQTMCVKNNHIYAYVEDSNFKSERKNYEKWIRNCACDSKYDYKIIVVDNIDEFIKKVNQASTPNDTTRLIDKHITERILVTCV